jgi:ketosteroid isomerase-like protein
MTTRNDKTEVTMTLRHLSSFAAVALIVVLASVLIGARSDVLAISVDADSAAVAAVVERYHGALSDGDAVIALSLLANDAMILESGDVETRDEYRSHHLPADIAFARAVPSVHGPVRVVLHGDAAWAISTSKTRGSDRGRIIDSQGAELMVVTRERDGWKIRAIHWSSRALRPSR